jgi:hypothetical protein
MTDCVSVHVLNEDFGRVLLFEVRNITPNGFQLNVKLLSSTGSLTAQPYVHAATARAYAYTPPPVQPHPNASLHERLDQLRAETAMIEARLALNVPVAVPVADVVPIAQPYIPPEQPGKL